MNRFLIVLFVILLLFSFRSETIILNGVEQSSSRIVSRPEIQTGLNNGSFMRDIYRAAINTAFYNPRVYFGDLIGFFNESFGNDIKIKAISKRYPKPSYPTFGWYIGVFLGWIIIALILQSISNIFDYSVP